MATEGQHRSQEHFRSMGTFLLLLLLFVVYKSIYNQMAFETFFDGGFYTSIAQNVRDGKGVTTNVSLYHHGYSFFPFPTPVYPVWPWVYGQVLKWFSVPVVAKWLPSLLYLTTLVAAYFWAVQMFPWSMVSSKWLDWNAGHTLVVLLGMHPNFQWATSRPYSEGLAYTFLFLALLRFRSLWKRPCLRTGLELGAWVGLLVLTRGQMAIVGIAAALILVWGMVALRPFFSYLWMSLGAGLSFLSLYGIWLAEHWDTLVRPGLSTIIRFDAAQASTLLHPIAMTRQTTGIYQFLFERLQGFVLAFELWGESSYSRVFFLLPYALLCLPFAVLLVLGSKQQGWLQRAWGWIRDSHHLNLLFVVALSVGGFLQIHSIRLVWGDMWYFNTRYSMVCSLLFWLSWVVLVQSSLSWLRKLGFAMLAGSFVMGILTTHEHSFGLKGSQTRYTYPYKSALKRWLGKQRESRGRLTIAMSYNQVQVVGWTTPNIHYHWVYPLTTPKEVRTLFEKFAVDYLVVPTGFLDTSSRRAHQTSRLKHAYRLPFSMSYPAKERERDLEEVVTLDGFSVYRYRRQTLCGQTLASLKALSQTTMYRKGKERGHQPYPVYPWLQSFHFPGTTEQQFLLARTGQYCVVPGSLLLQGVLRLNGKTLRSASIVLSKGKHMIRQTRGEGAISLLYLGPPSTRTRSQKQ